MDAQVQVTIPHPPNPDPALSLRGICKRFGTVQANDHIDLDVNAGEILGLLGENGAGKSTLMEIVAGVYQPDSGQICINGQPVMIRNPMQAAQLGIGMVHQHFTLIPELTVAENVVLASFRKHRYFGEQVQSARAYIRKVSERYGLQVDPSVPVWQLSVGARQRAEIIKVLYRGASCLILDEPTAVLTPQETDQFLSLLKTMAAEGTTVIFVSHKLSEVLSCCPRIVVLRRGRLVADLTACGATERELAHLMVGQDVSLTSDRQCAKGNPGAASLHVDCLSADNDRGLPAFSAVSFDVRQGEIVGVAGVAGNGQSELVECLAGLRSVTSGSVCLDGKDITRFSPARRRACGIAHIPEDRKGVGCILDLGFDENLILGEHRQRPVATRGWLRRSVIRERSARVIAQYRIQAPDPSVRARFLSGGNLQRLILARELARDPRVVLAVEPTRGLDVGAVEYTHQQLLQLRDQHRAILLVSTDLDEVLSMSDQVYVMHRGRFIGPLPADSGREEVGYVMLTGRELPEEAVR